MDAVPGARVPAAMPPQAAAFAAATHPPRVAFADAARPQQTRAQQASASNVHAASFAPAAARSQPPVQKAVVLVPSGRGEYYDAMYTHDFEDGQDRETTSRSRTSAAHGTSSASSGNTSVGGLNVPLSLVVMIALLALTAGAVIAWYLKPSHVRQGASSAPTATTLALVGIPAPGGASAASTSGPSSQVHAQAQPTGAPPSQPLQAAPANPPTPEQMKARYEAMLAASKAFVASIQSPHVGELTSEAQALALLDAKTPAVLFVYSEMCGHCRNIMPAFNEAAAAAMSSEPASRVPFFRAGVNLVPMPTIGSKFQVKNVPFFIGIKADGTIVAGTTLHDRTKLGILQWSETLAHALEPTAPTHAPPPAPAHAHAPESIPVPGSGPVVKSTAKPPASVPVPIPMPVSSSQAVSSEPVRRKGVARSARAPRASAPQVPVEVEIAAAAASAAEDA